MYFQNADYCSDPPGFFAWLLFFFSSFFLSEHSGDVSPKVAPMAPRPLTLRGRSHQMWSVCWDSGEGQRGLTRGGPVSPHCHREHGHRASVSTVINHPASPLFSPTLSFLLPLPFTLVFLFFFFPPLATVSHFASSSVTPTLLLSLFFVFFFPSHFLPPPSPAFSETLFST